MSSIRSIAISIAWAVLSAPLAYAQDAKLSEAGMLREPRAAIQEFEWQLRQDAGLLLLQRGPVSPPLPVARDLSTYREFHFGMDLAATAEQAGLNVAKAKVIHQRPAVIQELAWRPQLTVDFSRQGDPVRSVLFSFYNGQLFQILVVYDRYRTEGLSAEDVIEAISAEYGPATQPAAEVTFSSSQVYNNKELVIARWEDSLYSFNLFRSAFQPTFGMVGFSKRLDVLARAAIADAIRLDEQEAPQLEIDRQKKQEGKERAGREKARLANKPNFRP
jgi:hypothetical protein